MKTKLLFLGWLLAALGGCSYPPTTESGAWRRAEEFGFAQEMQATNGMAWPSAAIPPEVVMTRGMKIAARTEVGEITIQAGDQFERFYTWDGATRSAKLWPRKERWYGSLGIYYPGPGEHWKANHGITRGVLGEGILWFKTIEDAQAWIQRRRAIGTACVYLDSGLLVAFLKVPPRKQINVEVWQIMIGDQKPASLPGSNNDLITASQGLPTDQP